MRKVNIADPTAPKERRRRRAEVGAGKRLWCFGSEGG